MSYQLQHRESLGDNLRRICRQQIEEAIAIAKGEKKANDTPVHETRKHLKKTRAALRVVRKEIGCKQLRGAVQASYKQARKALAKATANPTTENFHAFRTKAKTLWYQLRILRPINPVVLKTLSDDLHSLGDLLGRAHDLSFLGERLRSEHGKSQWQREGHKLLAVIEVSQSDLQRGAAELAEHFFAECPRDFGCRVTTWLQEWEDKSSHSLAKALVT